MTYKVEIIGVGYEDFQKALEDEILFGGIKISVGDKIYQFKNHCIKKINPKTGKGIGRLHIPGSGALERILSKKEWKVKFEGGDFDFV